MFGDILTRYLFQIGSHDVRYKNFLQAQGIESSLIERKTLFDKTLQYHNARITKYLYYLNMYYGNQWFLRTPPEEQNQLIANYCAVTVDKNVAFLMNKGFLVESDFREIELFLQNNWKLNNAGTREDNLFGVQLATLGSIAGDVWFDIMFSKHDLTGEEYIKYNLLEVGKCFPVLERQQLKGFLYYGTHEIIDKENNGFADYKEQTEGYYYRPGSKKIIVEEKVKRTEQFDFLEIPVIHVANIPIPAMYYGLSDLMNVGELNMLYNKVISDMQDIIDYHAAPVTILKGAKGSELIRGPNRVWSLPKEASIDNLTLDGDLTGIAEQLKRLRIMIAEASKIPEGAVGKEQSISNTSAAALAIAYMPMYETMELKRITYGASLLKTNNLTIKLALLKGKLSASKIIKEALKKHKGEFSNYDKETKDRHYPFKEKINPDTDYDNVALLMDGQLPPELFETYITWFPPFKRDEKADLDTALSASGGDDPFWSKRHARSYTGMTEKESFLMEREIAEEKKRKHELQKELQPEQSAPPIQEGMNEEEREKFENSEITMTDKTGLEGDPDLKGERESIRHEQQIKEGN